MHGCLSCLFQLMFFSQPIIRNDNYGDIAKPGNGHYTKLAITIENIMPCNAAECLMDRLNTESAREEIKGSDTSASIGQAWRIMLRNTALYMFFALMIMTWFQNRNEANWDGR